MIFLQPAKQPYISKEADSDDSYEAYKKWLQKQKEIRTEEKNKVGDMLW